MNARRCCALPHKLRLVSGIACLIGLLTFAGPSNAAVIYDSPAQNFIIGVTGLVVTGTSNDGIYDVTFAEGSFDDVFDGATMTSDLTFQSSADSFVVVGLINTELNAATPHDRVASATSATNATSFFDDAYQLPVVADTQVDARISVLVNATGLWDDGGTGLNVSRTITEAPRICAGCLAKWASFDAVTVPEPSTLGLIGVGLAGLAFARRRKAA